MKSKLAGKKSRILLGAALLCLSGCGNQTRATTMHLVRTEGTVGVTDQDQKDVSLMDQLGLYSGYQVGTQARSYAWIDLDDVKLTKNGCGQSGGDPEDGKGSGDSGEFRKSVF